MNAARVLKVDFARNGSFEGSGEGDMGGIHLDLAFSGNRTVNPDCTMEATFCTTPAVTDGSLQRR